MNQARGERFTVISGCSGSGKSTLLAGLAERGATVVAEPGRRVVRRALERDEDALPRANPQRFAERCAALAREDFDRHRGSDGRVYFDRSLVDVACAVERNGLRWPDGLEPALRACRYDRMVFLSPPHRPWFENDAERRHPFEEAVAEFRALEAHYPRLGYEVVPLPIAPLAERIELVLARLP